MKEENLLEKIVEKSNENKLNKEQLIKLADDIKNPSIKKEIKKYDRATYHIKIGILGDTHITSRSCNLDFLNESMNWFKKEKVAFVIQSGDITDGEYLSRRHTQQLRVHGCDGAIQFVCDTFPKIDLPVFFIKGNHDFTFFNDCGVDICKHIAEKREDLIYLYPGNTKKGTSIETQILDAKKSLNDLAGENFKEDYWEGDIYIGPKNNCQIKIFHPGDGTTKQLSYKTQQIAESFHDTEKPNFVIIGHYHKIEYTFYRNIHLLQAGTTQEQYPWMRSKMIKVMIGSHILDLYIKDDGSIERVEKQHKGPKDFGIKI